MRIWKLTPLERADPIWKLWNAEPIFVRAESEVEARKLATLETLEYLPMRPGQPIAINPWSGHKKIENPAPPTLCEDITDQTSEYSADGPAAVLRHGEHF